MSAIIAEIQDTCPLVHELVQRTQRNARGNTLHGEELESVMVLCTLLNARSARIKGVQLMIRQQADRYALVHM